jgi:hypothetical protein
MSFIRLPSAGEIFIHGSFVIIQTARNFVKGDLLRFEKKTPSENRLIMRLIRKYRGAFQANAASSH